MGNTGNLHVPVEFACVTIDADHAAIDEIVKNGIFPHGDAARTTIFVSGNGCISHPHHNAGITRSQVDLVDPAITATDPHGAVVNQTVALIVALAVAKQAIVHWHGKSHLETTDRVAVDLVQAGVTMAAVVLQLGEPVLGLSVRCLQA